MAKYDNLSDLIARKNAENDRSKPIKDIIEDAIINRGLSGTIQNGLEPGNLRRQSYEEFFYEKIPAGINEDARITFFNEHTGVSEFRDLHMAIL